MSLKRDLVLLVAIRCLLQLNINPRTQQVFQLQAIVFRDPDSARDTTFNYGIVGLSLSLQGTYGPASQTSKTKSTVMHPCELSLLPSQFRKHDEETLIG